MSSLLKIIQYGHPLLRQKSLEVKSLGSREKALIEAMRDTMYAARGIGLAAPQVGVMERIFVADADQEAGEDGERGKPGRLRVFINPEIVWESADDSPFTEGCLSIPGLEGEIYRPSSIRVAARDENFEPFEVEADGLLARVLQHEYDHLNGVLFLDHLTLMKRSLLAGQLGRIKKESLKELPDLPAEYPILINKG